MATRLPELKRDLARLRDLVATRLARNATMVRRCRGELLGLLRILRDCPRFSGGRHREAATEGAQIGASYALPDYCRER